MSRPRGAGRKPAAKRPKGRKRLSRRAKRQPSNLRRLLVVAAGAAVVASVAIALLVRAARPPERQPFRFPAPTAGQAAAPAAAAGTDTGSRDVAPAGR
jgi:hypothetical protein